MHVTRRCIQQLLQASFSACAQKISTPASAGGAERAQRKTRRATGEQLPQATKQCCNIVPSPTGHEHTPHAEAHSTHNPPHSCQHCMPQQQCTRQAPPSGCAAMAVLQWQVESTAAIHHALSSCQLTVALPGHTRNCVPRVPPPLRMNFPPSSMLLLQLLW